MAEQHPITPPPELVRKWISECSPYEVPADRIATKAARWGWEQRTAWDAAWLDAELQKARDEELDACCHEVQGCTAAASCLNLTELVNTATARSASAAPSNNFPTPCKRHDD